MAKIQKQIINEWIENETWFSADEAIEAGLATAKSKEDDDKDAAAAARIDLEAFGYTNIPDALKTKASDSKPDEPDEPDDTNDDAVQLQRQRHRHLTTQHSG